MFTTSPPTDRPRRPGRLHTVRRAAHALTTPLLPEDFLTLVDPLWSTTGLRGRVESVHRAATGATTLRIRPGRGWAGHHAGQYVRVGVDVDGVRHWRSYSISSAEHGPLAITVRELPGGTVSPHLNHRTPVGTIVELEPAAGEFTLPRPLPDRLLMITAGSGVTPVMSMLRTLEAENARPDLVLLHSAPTGEQCLFHDELRSLPRRHPRARVHLRRTATEGRLDLAELDTLCPDWRARPAYVCGPSGLLDDAERTWTGAGCPENLRIERFTPPVRSAGGTGGTVRLGGGEPVAVDGASSLLEAGEAAGALMPSGCRMGICHGCVLPLRAGQVRDLRTGEVHGEPGDLVQTCISGASGPAHLDLPDHRR